MDWFSFTVICASVIISYTALPGRINAEDPLTEKPGGGGGGGSGGATTPGPGQAVTPDPCPRKYTLSRRIRKDARSDWLNLSITCMTR